MRSKGIGMLCGVAAIAFVLGPVAAQNTPAAKPTAPPAPTGLLSGPATVAPHWSKYKYPESIPDGATYYIVQKGDTLWDLAKLYLGNPYLWPQIWDQNKYVTDAHWIYPGDPLLMPKVALVSGQAGQPGGLGTEEGQEGLPPEGPGGADAVGAASVLYPVSEPVTIQCAHYIVPGGEDDSLQIIGSEQGNSKNAFGDRDILYLGKGSNAGVKTGDVYSFHHASYDVKHPDNGRKLGQKVETTGWGRVVLVQENTATIVVEQACMDIHLGDYLKPYEKLNVPLIVRRPPANRLTRPSGKAHGYVIDIGENLMIAASGQLLSIDLGSQDGLAPGSVLTIYRITYPSVPTPRDVVGEVAVLTIRDRTATAKIINSRDAVFVGDEVELR